MKYLYHKYLSLKFKNTLLVTLIYVISWSYYVKDLKVGSYFYISNGDNEAEGDLSSSSQRMGLHMGHLYSILALPKGGGGSCMGDYDINKCININIVYIVLYTHTHIYI